jgi:hypothetical protein
MAELADAADSKSADRKVVGVRHPLPAPRRGIKNEYLARKMSPQLEVLFVPEKGR